MFDALRKLLGMGGEQQQMPVKSKLAPGMPGGYSKARPILQNNVQPRGRIVTPGYEEAARNYEAAFSRGDLNSPYIIGQDPKNFGYAEDIGQYGGQPVQPQRSQAITRQGYSQQNQMPQFEDVLKSLRIKF